MLLLASTATARVCGGKVRSRVEQVLYFNGMEAVVVVFRFNHGL
jgi:hypothetical protein